MKKNMLAAAIENAPKLGQKVKAVENLFKRQVDEVFACPTGEVGYRMKNSFRAESNGSFGWTDPATKQVLSIGEEGFPIATKSINDALPIVSKALRLNSNGALAKNLFEAKFHATLYGELAVTLMYRVTMNEEVEDDWYNYAQDLGDKLKEDSDLRHVSIIGRARKQVLSTGREFLREVFEVEANGEPHEIHYRQHCETFSQPNAMINKLMLDWAVRRAKNDQGYMDNDLLEIYCGNGNFTVPLSKFCFNKVLAAEISRLSTKDAWWALNYNQVDHCHVARLSSEELRQAILGVRPFTRLGQVRLNEYSFRTVLVDPPRTGLDPHSIDILTRQRGQILYISCNPVSLLRDIQLISEANPNLRIEHMACFDQFPGTDHIEVACELWSD